jgi:hypothetical protein
MSFALPPEDSSLRVHDSLGGIIAAIPESSILRKKWRSYGFWLILTLPLVLLNGA